jgi:methylthioribose-1-phosphate isomerase
MDYYTIRWSDGAVSLIDQRVLPHEVRYLRYDDYRALAQAITDMVVRGAPAIGAAGAYGMALAAGQSMAATADGVRQDLAVAAEVLRAARPTAVNLGWGVDRVWRCAQAATLSDGAAVRAAVLTEAHAIAEEDGRINRAMGRNALDLIPQGATIIHHCNTGTLATVEYGTALGVIRAAHEAGKNIHVLVDETRPRLQGARLTAWELQQLGIAHTVIVDGAAAHMMRTRKVDLCVVGCDRVAANGDTANKIGTYHLALAAHAHGIPFYVACPTSTIDFTLAHGDLIPIEERDPREVAVVAGTQLTPDGTAIGNPAFDVTPAGYIAAIITERGVARPPYVDSLAALRE